jgi:hypothetical protein
MPGPPMPRRAAAIAAEAFVLTYPLVLMEVARAQLTATATAGALRAPVNQFAHMPGFPRAASAPLMSPNVDTLTSSAWLDLSAEPLVLSLPDTAGRYYAMPMYDAWTTVFASLGTRTTGTKARQVVLASPSWRSSLPPEMHVVQSPTSQAWLVGHIRSDGPEDHATVRRLQEQIRLTPLSRWPDESPPDAAPDVVPPVDPTSPVTQVARMEPMEYFTRVARLLVGNPADRTDRSRVDRMSILGVGPGRPPHWSRGDRTLERHIARGMAEGLAQVEAAASRLSSVNRGWACPSDLTRRQSEPVQRAALAWTGLGALPRADGLVYTTHVNGDGGPLSGAESHVLRFAPGAAPPARAFWSLTVHDDDALGAGHRTALAVGDRNPLWHAPDGSLTVHLSVDPPRSEATNWLPTPNGPFSLALRLYWPEPPALDGTWWPPAVTLAEEVSGRKAALPPAAIG